MSKASEPDLQVISRDARKVQAQALVVGVGQSPDGPVLVDSPLSQKSSSAVAGSFALLGVTGAADQVVRLPGLPELDAEMLVLAGLGPVAAGEPLSTEALRRAAGSAIRQLAGTSTVALALPAATVEDAAAVAEGALLGAYSFTEHRSAHSAKVPAPVSSITLVTSMAGEADLQPALDRARIVARAVNATRTLVNQPPSPLYPETFAAAAREAARPLPVKVTVWDEKKLEREGFGGILGVGKGSARPPRLVKVEYSPARAKAKLALVGKGITFDSGGLSLKPAAGMQTMKCDMGGAAVVLNALLAIAELGLPVKVTASGTAQRPSDVMTTYGGRTVEVLNTDAEGRLVMADGLVAASEEAPDVLIDVATLTGAQMIALGNRVSAVMGEEGVRDAVKAAADRSGELFWPMPIPEELRASLDSSVADIANHGERFGGMMTAASFLREFVGEVDGVKIPWAHLDIAGPAFNEGSPYGYTPKEGTGVAVRTLVAYAEDVVSRSA